MVSSVRVSALHTMAPSLVSPDERALLARLAERDGDAFTVLYERYVGLVFGAAVHVLNDQVAAEQVVEGVFLVLWRHGAAIDLTQTSLRVWLLAHVFRRCAPTPNHGIR